MSPATTWIRDNWIIIALWVFLFSVAARHDLLDMARRQRRPQPRPRENAKMTLQILNTRIWYRLVKVLFVASLLMSTAVGLVIAARAYPPAYSFAEDRSTLVCTSGNESVFKLSGLGSLYDYSSKAESETITTGFPGIFELKTSYDHEITRYFQETRIPGILPPMPDGVRRDFRQLCGLNPHDDSDATDRLMKDIRTPRLLPMSEVEAVYPDWRQARTVEAWYAGFKEAVKTKDSGAVAFYNDVGERFGELDRRLTPPDAVSLYWHFHPEWRQTMKFSDLSENQIQEYLKRLGVADRVPCPLGPHTWRAGRGRAGTEIPGYVPDCPSGSGIGQC